MVRGSIIEGSGGSRFGNFRFVPSLVKSKNEFSKHCKSLEISCKLLQYNYLGIFVCLCYIFLGITTKASVAVLQNFIGLPLG